MNSGEELVKAFRKVDPKLPIIVTAPPSRTPDDLQKSCPNASNYLTLPWDRFHVTQSPAQLPEQ